MADKSKKTIDPFDVEALEKSLNDSATRVSTIWVSYLVFGLYLVVAAGNVTHRQLFLEEPIKLPVLNIDLPLVGFFFLAPILFTVVHAYVLIQVLLLARTAAGYNEAVEHTTSNETYQARVRQRLANTLFAQIFAGSPREREGLLGWILRLMAWATLAVAPVFVLLTFQTMFLPYHSTLVTWAHRILIALDLVTVLLLWPGVLDARSDVTWRSIIDRRTTLIVPIGLMLFSAVALSFPSEPHARWTRYLRDEDPYDHRPLECRTTSPIGTFISEKFDRLSLPNEDVVDDDRLAKIEAATKAKGRPLADSERTRKFADRDLSCSTLSNADLRLTSFDNANLRGAIFTGAELQGATLAQADLQGAYLFNAKLQGAELFATQLQRARLDGAQLQGASLYGAQLQGASLREAQLQAAILDEAELQAAVLTGAQFQGASLRKAQLQAAFLENAQFQGASFQEAQLQGAQFYSAQLQGTRFDNSRLTHANILDSYLWRAVGGKCDDAQVDEPHLDPIIDLKRGESESIEEIEATADAIEKFIEKWVGGVPESSREKLRTDLRTRLALAPKPNEQAEVENVWRSCAKRALPVDEHQKMLAVDIIDLVCNAAPIKQGIAHGIWTIWIEPTDSPLGQVLARALLGLEGKPCLGASELEASIKTKLREIAEKKPLNYEPM